ncbi:MAG: phosphoribosylanthranilate isomerase [Verrucomicrobia bacterium]|nr:phosphoribosylanthranilate isomerase [Verrucomicrobiota bacterium]
MIAGIRLKVCGLTSLVDAEAADAVGADYLGFILYPQSPRHITLAQFVAMAARLPPGRRPVAVMVEPSAEELAPVAAAGFVAVQIHFREETPLAHLEAWSERVGSDRLWLAPKLPPGREPQPAWLPLARTFVVDTFHAAGFGGSGQTGDWAAFPRLRVAHPDHHWILAGGLKPENIATAVRQTGARWVDVNSGVESAPGVKDAARLRAFGAALRAAATAQP